MLVLALTLEEVLPPKDRTSASASGRVILVSYAIHLSPTNWVSKIKDAFASSPAVVQGLLLAVVCAWMVYMSHVQPVPFIYFAF